MFPDLRDTAIRAPLVEAALHWRARRDLVEHPDGAWRSASGSSPWWPAEEERALCCDAIREPSWRWPLSLLRHCCSAEHVAQIYAVDVAELRAEARRQDAAEAADADELRRLASRTALCRWRQTDRGWVVYGPAAIIQQDRCVMVARRSGKPENVRIGSIGRPFLGEDGRRMEYGYPPQGGWRD